MSERPPHCSPLGSLPDISGLETEDRAQQKDTQLLTRVCAHCRHALRSQLRSRESELESPLGHCSLGDNSATPSFHGERGRWYGVLMLSTGPGQTQRLWRGGEPWAHQNLSQNCLRSLPTIPYTFFYKRDQRRMGKAGGEGPSILRKFAC